MLLRQIKRNAIRSITFPVNSIRSTVEPWYNERPRDWQNMFALTRFSYIKVLFNIFYYSLGKKKCSIYRVLRYIEVRYIEVPLYNIYSWKGQFQLRIMTQILRSQSSMSPSMLASPAGVFREQTRAPLKKPAGEATSMPNLWIFSHSNRFEMRGQKNKEKKKDKRKFIVQKVAWKAIGFYCCHCRKWWRNHVF